MYKCFLAAGLLIFLVACEAEQPDYPATISVLENLVSEQEQALADCSTKSAIPTAAPTTQPTPTIWEEILPTKIVATRKPATTIQRPPTATPTRTPTMTPTTTPTATPLPDAAVGELLTNLRSGPGVGFLILMEAQPGTPLTVLGKSADSEWLKVTMPDGSVGWMFYLPLKMYISIDSLEIVN
ncbi:MAG: SH3 domain-containing protein [Anaerolineales bacterium]|nr:SH3 domain-containing protein [Anaerolineales bacterium]